MHQFQNPDALPLVTDEHLACFGDEAAWSGPSNEQLATAAAARSKKLKTLDDTATPLLALLEKECKKPAEPSVRIQGQFDDGSNHSEPTRVATGWETLAMGFRPTHRMWWDQYAMVAQPAGITRRERYENSGNARVIDLYASRTENVQRHLRREFERQAWLGTSPAFADFNTLNGLDDTAGFIEPVAVGSQTNTIHNVSKATYAGRRTMSNLYYPGNGDASADLLIQMRQLDGEALMLEDQLGAGARPVMFMEYTILDFYRRSLSAFEQYQTAESAGKEAGQRVMVFGRNRIIALRENTLPGSGSTKWAVVRIDPAALELRVGKTWMAAVGDPEVIPGTGVTIQVFEAYGQLCLADEEGRKGLPYQLGVINNQGTW